MEKDILVKVTARNCPGLLQRICALFSRRFFNIVSIVAAQNLNPETSQIFIVLSVEILDPERVILREHLMVKVARTDKNNGELIAAANAFRASIVQVGNTEMVMELSGDSKKLDSFAELLRPFGILEMLRTGAMAMTVC